ncbi:Serine/threonine-protein kinase smg1, partial [Dissophora globulifera]
SKTCYDFESVTAKLEEIQGFIDNANDSKELLPSLDQLINLSGQHPGAWRPFFKTIVDLLVGWYIDRGTTVAVRKRIGDVLSTFSAQWPEAAEFSRDLLDYFIKDIETATADATANDLSTAIDTVRLVMSCFNIIANALMLHVPRDLDRLALVQRRAVDMLPSVARLSSSLDAAGNDIILTLSLADASVFYEHQPKAIQYLAAQFEQPRSERGVWTQKIQTTKKILAAWAPRIHPKVSLEIVHPKGNLMQLRWLLPTNPTRLQDVLDIVIAAVPEPTPGTDIDIVGHTDILLRTWSGISHEVDAILHSLGQRNSMSAVSGLAEVVDNAEHSFKSTLEHSRTLGADYHGVHRIDYRRRGSRTISHISNMTFDILLLVELARLWPGEAQSMFLRLLGTLRTVPESRLSIVAFALKEISASRKYFIQDCIKDDPTSNFSASALGISVALINTFVDSWRLLSSAVKLCIIGWNAGIFTALRPYRDTLSSSPTWDVLRNSLSTNFYQLTTIAGADEDERVRGAIASIFEGFVNSFGTFKLGPNFILVLKSPNSGVFRYPHFSTVLSALTAIDGGADEGAGGVHLENSDGQDGDMLQRLFHSCQGKEILAKVNFESGTDVVALEQVGIFQHSYKLLTYWSLWEAARYCVLSRLRTPFGGPQQTLDSLEKHLNSLLLTGHKDAAGNSRLVRLRDYLTFLDRLELQVYNAHHGTALGVIPLTPKPSIVFVRSNKKMWDDWFSRIRGRVVEGAKAAGESEIVIRNGYILLAEHFGSLSRGAVNDIMPWLDEFERVLVDLVEALVATNESDAITGLYVWCRRAIKDMSKQSSSGRSKSSRSERSTQYPRYRNACLNEGQALALSQISLDWINTAVAFAQTRYEQSTKDAVSLMGSLTGTDALEDVNSPAEFLCQEITNSLGDLYNYQQLQSFMESIPIDAYADQTMLWSEEPLTQGLREYCADEALEAWKALEEFYDSSSRDLMVPAQYSFDRSGSIGRNFLFASKVHQLSGLRPAVLDQLRQQALVNVEPSAEFLVYNGLKHASATLIDALMLNTAVAATPVAIKEFMGQIALIPDELRMNMFRKDLRFWTRLDTIVDVAKRHAPSNDSLVRRQSNEFKFLLSKIARRSECHDFASSIPRTWEGALSPEIQFEEAKAAMAKHDYSTALSASSRILVKVGTMTGSTEEDRARALFRGKIYLKMAKWSRSTKPQLTESNLKTFEDILCLEHQDQLSLQARIEVITATCLQNAIDIGPNYRKSWFAFGTHHYKQGWGILDELGSFRFHHPVATAANKTLMGILEDAGVEKLEEHSKDIFCVFVKHCASGQPFDEAAACKSIREHLMTIDAVAEFENTISLIIESFRKLLQKILAAYRLAIYGYFRFLQFAAVEFDAQPPKSMTISGEEAETDVSQSEVSDEITATLRLLRLLAKHGGQLFDTFQENLVDINVCPWTNIIPQLFARLDHPEEPVQDLIADLLCKIGEQYPQLIVFHCVVGGNSAHNSPCQRRLLRFIGDFVNNLHPELMLQVQHLIRELERVTVLWEEVWYKKIVVGLPELKNTLQELTDQYQGLDAISGLGAEDKDAVMSDNYQQSVIPLLAIFENLYETHASPETKHERWFVSTFGGRIQAALACLRSPNSWGNLFEGVMMMKEVYMDLGKELSGTRVLQLSDLSPELASIRSSLIDIPSPHQGTGVTIQSFEQQVVVIPTKTKPKKLTLVGSDGKRYTFLFKGLEDLHLDERVMQLLRISNGMLQRDKEANTRHLNARHYAVVPLSDNSGMIQWVENTVSLFTIISKWQHRELMCARWMNDDNSTGPLQGPQRATEIYHEKAVAALKKAGLPANHPRRQWPKSILLDLYHEMANETPGDLLEREIWSSSPTPAEWWRKSVQFARSTAVMSMIGYVIGLGDRHLDNILIDFTTGDLVHIDYNVCFEKGKRLRIPEIVPFRLSRNMLTSLGVTGVEGNFRIGCEQTMKVMRKNKEILVTLLEAFVYDPLVDWQIESTTVQGAVGGIAGPAASVAGGPGMTMAGQGVESSEGENGSSVSGTSVRDSRSSAPANGHSTRSVKSRRRLSNESVTSASSVSSRSVAGVDSFRRWNVAAGDQGDAMAIANGAPVQQQQQQQPPLHQRNAYAVHILRRVRHKLEGRDFDAVKKCKVTEQVDRVIQEATNVENLATMYEGWTPWL